VEFQFGGEATIERPARPEAASDAEWADYLFYRNNVRGVHVERWVHVFGCRQWFLLTRDTLTHEIRCAHRMDEPYPDVVTTEAP
jgi:sarcosine oxidase subunit delta